jgi:hypothetical protein
MPIEEMSRRCQSFLNIRSIAHSDFSLSSIFGFDETALFLGSPSNTTIDVRGSTTVGIAAGNIEKFRITGIFGGFATGRKVAPVLLWHSTKQEPELVIVNGIPIIKCKNAWISDKVMKLFLNYLFPFRCIPRLLMVADSARPHFSTSTLALYAQKNIRLALIPGGITSYVQPADVYWFKSLKSKINNLVEIWLARRDLPMTTSGNVKSPSMTQCADWARAAWSEISEDYIARSWQGCILGAIEDLHAMKDDAIGPRLNELMQPNSVDQGIHAQESDELIEENAEDVEDD